MNLAASEVVVGLRKSMNCGNVGVMTTAAAWTYISVLDGGQRAVLGGGYA